MLRSGVESEVVNRPSGAYASARSDGIRLARGATAGHQQHFRLSALTPPRSLLPFPENRPELQPLTFRQARGDPSQNCALTMIPKLEGWPTVLSSHQPDAGVVQCVRCYRSLVPRLRVLSWGSVHVCPHCLSPIQKPGNCSDLARTASTAVAIDSM